MRNSCLYKVLSRIVFTSKGIGGDPLTAQLLDDVVDELVEVARNWEFASANEKCDESKRMTESKKFSRSSLERNVPLDSRSSESKEFLINLKMSPQQLNLKNPE